MQADVLTLKQLAEHLQLPSLARDPRRHLILLARAASLCRHPGFLDGIRRATSAAAVVTLVRDTERLLLGDTGATGR